ncbi:MAG: rod shape-determining protein MreC [Caldilineaceae bacterium SB0668_bin_21]|nr:rod shape-determining protein MreC [Caldilineaceae bacterium SB0668_bin_21]MYC23877.1 rod shape-determining protein MreC [Caldilineaceae bacterium SB0662_bin_25]
MRNSDQRGWGSVNFGLKIVILTLMAVLLLALQQTGRLGTVEGLVTMVTAPGQSGLSTLTNRLSASLTNLRNYRSLQRRLTELERIVESLSVENLRLQEVERENQRLRELLQFAETRPSFELQGGQIIARVIGKNATNFLNVAMIDLGARHGIRVGMPVVNEQGLVGRISEVTSTTSKVLLITDPSSTVNAILQSSRLTGVISGRPGSHPVIGFLPQGTEIGVGEVVLTSGMGGTFPKGIHIGQVVEVRQRDVNVFQEAVVRPTVNFGQLEEVMVVTNFDPSEFVPLLDTLPDPPGETSDE